MYTTCVHVRESFLFGLPVNLKVAANDAVAFVVVMSNHLFLSVMFVAPTHVPYVDCDQCDQKKIAKCL